MKVLHAAKFYPPSRGGMETVVGDLCRGTAGRWDVSVVAANHTATTVVERVDGVEVVRAAAYGTASSVSLCPSLPLHLWGRRADCVVLHEPNPIAGSALFLRTPGRRLVIWHHSDVVRPAWAPATYGRLQRALYRRADCVIVSSPNLVGSSALVRQARRVEVIPFGIRLDRFQSPAAAVQAHADRLRSATAGPRILFVGRFVYYKGLDVLIEAMAGCPGTLVLVGEGPLEPELRRRVDALGLTDRVVFAGRVGEEDLPAQYRSCDLLVLPSVARSETFGVVQVEAMASGVPVISTALPTGVPWVNQHGESGLVVPPGDAPALAAALTMLLTEEERRRAMGRRAMARAAAHFGLARMVETFRQVVESVVGAEAGATRRVIAPAEAS